MFLRTPNLQLSSNNEDPLPPLFPQLSEPLNNKTTLSGFNLEKKNKELSKSAEPRGYDALSALFCSNNGTIEPNLSSAIYSGFGTRLLALTRKSSSSQSHLLGILIRVFGKKISTDTSLSALRKILINGTGFDFSQLSKIIRDTIKNDLPRKYKKRQDCLRNPIVLLGIIQICSKNWPGFEFNYGLKFKQLCLQLRALYHPEENSVDFGTTQYEQLPNPSKRKTPGTQKVENARTKYQKKMPTNELDIQTCPTSVSTTSPLFSGAMTPLPQTTLSPPPSHIDTLVRDNCQRNLLDACAEMVRQIPPRTPTLSAAPNLFYPLSLYPLPTNELQGLYSLSGPSSPINTISPALFASTHSSSTHLRPATATGAYAYSANQCFFPTGGKHQAASARKEVRPLKQEPHESILSLDL